MPAGRRNILLLTLPNQTKKLPGGTMKKLTPKTILITLVWALAITIWAKVLKIDTFSFLLFIILWDFGIRLINQVRKH